MLHSSAVQRWANDLRATVIHDKRASKQTARPMTTAFYPGSFDPLTNGHLDVLIQSLNVASEVIVAIGIHPGKTPLFSFDERADLIRQSLADALPEKTGNISVVAFDNLVVDA